MLDEREILETIADDAVKASSNDTAKTRDLKTRVRAFPKDANSWFLLGQHLRKMNNLRGAEGALRKALNLNPLPDAFWIELAKLFSDLGIEVELADLKNWMSKDGAKANIIVSLEQTLHLEEFPLLLRPTSRSKVSQCFEVSPCIECPEYRYYGCTRDAPCEDYRRWRSSDSS